jgi:hypothetical protein
MAPAFANPVVDGPDRSAVRRKFVGVSDAVIRRTLVCT